MNSSGQASFQFTRLQRDLGQMTNVQRRKLRAEFDRVGAAALSDARSRAGAWSSRIPAMISGKPLVDATRGRVGYTIRVGISESAPHGRVYEGLGQRTASGSFRHPVFADTNKPRSEWTWTEKNSRIRPYLWPAVNGRAADLRRGLENAVDDAARDAGFR